MKIERLLINLGHIAESDSSYSEKARSLIDWYYEHDELTKKQLSFIHTMITNTRQRKKDKKDKDKGGYKLYAIDDGVNVKLGYASNPQARLKGLQTGNAKKLILLWTYPAGDYEGIARKLERMLHRYCKKYRRRGEWFSKDCLPRVQKFEIKRKIIDKLRKKKEQERQREIEEEELEILYEANKHI